MTKRNRQPLGEGAQLLVRLWVGVGFLAIGLFQMLTTHRYPPGDIRGEPWYWTSLGAVMAVIGIAILASAVVVAIRRRGGKP